MRRVTGKKTVRSLGRRNPARRRGFWRGSRRDERDPRAQVLQGRLRGITKPRSTRKADDGGSVREPWRGERGGRRREDSSGMRSQRAARNKAVMKASLLVSLAGNMTTSGSGPRLGPRREDEGKVEQSWSSLGSGFRRVGPLPPTGDGVALSRRVCSRVPWKRATHSGPWRPWKPPAIATGQFHRHHPAIIAHQQQDCGVSFLHRGRLQMRLTPLFKTGHPA